MTREVCFCDGPWADIPPENRPETVLEREHTLGSIVNELARCKYTPTGPSVELSAGQARPWFAEPEQED